MIVDIMEIAIGLYAVCVLLAGFEYEYFNPESLEDFGFFSLVVIVPALFICHKLNLVESELLEEAQE